MRTLTVDEVDAVSGGVAPAVVTFGLGALQVGFRPIWQREARRR